MFIKKLRDINEFDNNNYKGSRKLPKIVEQNTNENINDEENNHQQIQTRSNKKLWTKNK